MVIGGYVTFMSKPAISRRVVFALYDGVLLLDLAGPAEVFAEANRQVGRTFYSLSHVSNAPNQRIDTSVGLTLSTDPLPSVRKKLDTLIIVGGNKDARRAALHDEAFVTWLRATASRARRTASVCSGAFFLGKVGLLDDKAATTHWAALNELQTRHPRARIARDALFIQDGQVWSSAGVLSGVDMCLAMVRQDLGSELALRVARQLVAFVVRHGGQSQFSGVMNLQSQAAGTAFVDLVAWLEAEGEPTISVESMAERLKMSVRTLHRHCQETFRMSPARLLRSVRLERARELLHGSEAELKVIASSAGFASPEAFSKAFRERFGVSPGRYREGFAGEAT